LIFDEVTGKNKLTFLWPTVYVCCETLYCRLLQYLCSYSSDVFNSLISIMEYCLCSV